MLRQKRTESRQSGENCEKRNDWKGKDFSSLLILARLKTLLKAQSGYNVEREKKMKNLPRTKCTALND